MRERSAMGGKVWGLFLFLFLCASLMFSWDVPFLEAQLAAPLSPARVPTPEQIKKAKEMLEKGVSPEAVREQLALPEALTEKLAPAEAPAEKPAHLEEVPRPGEEPVPPEVAEPREEKPAAPPEEALSTFEAYIQKKRPLAVSTDIKQFGYELFEKPPSTFAPVDIVPVGPDYLLGTGDEIRIIIWGRVDAEYATVIDRDGKISLPRIGVLHLAGLTFAEVKAFIEKQFSRHYKPSEVNISVSMGKLRSIQIFVVGKAKKPGSYTLSSFSTLINALFAAAGPSKVGTMRDIQVKRDGNTIVHFDVYDFLLKGNKTKDIKLMPEDVIFIPTVGPLVGIAGNVKSAAIYELKGETKLMDLIEMAGGVKATGYFQRVQVERILENEARVVLDINLKELTKQDNLVLRDGDLVKIFSVSPKITNPIELVGNLLRPGTYEWRQGIKVLDLIKSPEDFLPDTFFDFAMIERYVWPDYHKEYLSFDLGKLIFKGDEIENIPLRPYDTVVVFNKWDLMEKKKVRITGAVNKPGGYEYRPNMRLSDLLKLAGGLKRPEHPESYLPAGMIIRRMPPDFHEETISFDFSNAIIEQEKEADLVLEPLDEVRIFDSWELAQERNVRITGAVNTPGTYPWTKNMRVSDLLKLANGTKYYAHMEEAELTRVTPTPEGPKTERFNIYLERAIHGDPQHDMILQEDDYLFVRTIPDWRLYRIVEIKGEVKFPGIHAVKKGERISSLIRRAGGLTPEAYLRGAVFSRESARQIQEERVRGLIDQLEEDVLRTQALTAEATTSEAEAEGLKQSLTAKRDLLRRLRGSQATGRVVIVLDTLDRFEGSNYDMELEDGDSLTIPTKSGIVNVMGSVYNPTSIVYTPGKTVDYYLNKVGGTTPDAEEGEMYVVKADGTVVSRTQKGRSSLLWDPEKNRWTSSRFISARIDRGDSILVPSKVTRFVWKKEIKDWTTIIYQIAVAAGVIVALY